MERDPRKDPKKGDVLSRNNFMGVSLFKVERVTGDTPIVCYRYWKNEMGADWSEECRLALWEWRESLRPDTIIYAAERDPSTEPQPGDCWLRTSAGDTIIEVNRVSEGNLSWIVHPLDRSLWGAGSCHVAFNAMVPLSQWIDFAKEMVLLRTSEGFVEGKRPGGA